MTCVTNIGGGLQYCNFNGSGGGASVTLENVYSAPGAFTFHHALNSIFYQIHCVTRTGSSTYAPATWTDNPVDANDASVTVPAAGDYICSFSAVSALAPDFSIATSPTTLTFWPTMSGTQTTTAFTDTQTAIAGYSGTVTYSTSGLPSGINSNAFSPTTITGSGTNTFTLSFPASQTPATSSFTVTGTDGTKTHTTSPSITVGNINQGMVECWAMTDGSGSSFADNCGTSNTQTLATGTCTWASNTGLPGSTCTFSSTAYALGVNQTATNFDGSSAFSVSFWTNMNNASTYHAFISTLDPANSYKGWEIGTYNGTTNVIEVLLDNVINTNAIQLGTTAALSTGTLYYIVMTYDGSKTAAGVKVYVNGSLQSTVVGANNLTGSLANTKNAALGGRTDGTIPINGILAYARIYNRVLSQTDITNYYAAGAR